MSLDIVGLHKLIDEWAAKERLKEEKATEAKVEGAIASPAEPSTEPNATPAVADEVAEKVQKDRQLVRTKTSGDRVYLIDSVNKTRQWITTPEILAALGFTLNDVKDMDETDFLKYTMGPALYKLPDGKS